jgi:hypothetical protein
VLLSTCANRNRELASNSLIVGPSKSLIMLTLASPDRDVRMRHVGSKKPGDAQNHAAQG